MLTVAIVEDDKGYSSLLEKYITKYGKEKGESFKVSVYEDGLSFLAVCDTGFNIVLMDIEMPMLDGLKTAAKLRSVDKNASLIFVTNMAKYAVNGYEVDAIDFIVKPVDYFNFSLKFDKAVRLQKKKSPEFMILSTDSGIVKIDISEIKYVESLQHYLTFYTENGEYKTRSSMKDMEKKFASKNFVRCNNSYLVNLAYVDKVRADSVIIGEATLPISRLKKKSFMDALALYYGGVT